MNDKKDLITENFEDHLTNRIKEESDKLLVYNLLMGNTKDPVDKLCDLLMNNDKKDKKFGKLLLEQFQREAYHKGRKDGMEECERNAYIVFGANKFG